MQPITAKQRLDRLIQKSRADLYKPIAIAEILFRARTMAESVVHLGHKDSYRRSSYEWTKQIVRRLHGKNLSLNSRYWDQLFDDEVLPPPALLELGRSNTQFPGMVEVYIYSHLRQKFSSLEAVRRIVRDSLPEQFRLEDFLGRFQTEPSLRRSVDKAYEMVVYALFSSVVQALDATVTLAVNPQKMNMLTCLEDFTQLVLGVDTQHLAISQPARLYRVGTANANDAGLDMWANFGPAVQVKHLTLQPDQVGDICGTIRADQVLIVCRDADKPAIELLLLQLGYQDKLRGVITEQDLIRWYTICCSSEWASLLGIEILRHLDEELSLEFPLADWQKWELFYRERAYNSVTLSGDWAGEPSGTQ
jgi:type II restriction enzyme